MTRPVRRPAQPVRPANLDPAPKTYTYGGSRPWGGKWSRDSKETPNAR